MIEYVDIPRQFESIFEAAEQYVSSYFKGKTENPQKAEIKIGGERYILVRAEGFCHQFMVALKELYTDAKMDDAVDLARGVLYDLAFAMGMADARAFHKATGVDDPIERLSTGPVHFAFTGWGRVSIHPDSVPSPDTDYYLHYDHPNSFESATWLQSGHSSNVPICFMNAGYSAGWCTVSFGIPLVAVEVACRAAGDDHCRFIMAHRDHMNERLDQYLGSQVVRSPGVTPLMLRVQDMRQQLQETRREARIHLLANEGSGECVTIFDEQDRIAYVNRSTIKTFGYTESELIGSEPELVTRGACLEAMQNGEAWSGDLELLRKDGTSFPARVRANPILGEGKSRLGYYLICRNITLLKKAEREKRDAEKRLQEAKHDHSLAMAHAARLAAMGEMAAVMAHELNQPLGGIKNYLKGSLEEIRSGSAGSDIIAAGLEETSRLVDKAAGIIKRLRIFASPGEDRMVSYSISRVISEVLDLLQPRIRRRGIETAVKLPESDPPLIGDPLRIEQVLLNLVVNSCDALQESEEKKLEIEVKTQDGQVAEITIADTGPGIRPDILDMVFEPFYSTKEGSLGLGLSISSTIIREHGGRIETRPRDGKGTVMVVSLPLDLPSDIS